MPRTMDSPSASRPPPAPLVEREHVLCPLTEDSADEPVDAIVVALSADYVAAANEYKEHMRHLPDNVNSDPFSSGHHFPHHDLIEEDVVSVEAQPTNSREHDNYTVDLTVLDTIDLDVDVSGQKISVRETDDGNAQRPNYATTPARPQYNHNSSPRHRPTSRPKRRRPQEVSMPAALEAYTENGQIMPSVLPAPHPITHGRVYVHFSGRDRRLDRWVEAAVLVRASASSVAAAASGVVDNILVDNAVQAEFVGADTQQPARKLTRSRRREFEEINPISERDMGNEAIARMERAREESTKVRNITSIVFGVYHIDAWYYSPFSAKNEFAKTLYMCNFCLKHVRTRKDFTRHCSTCRWKCPPGSIIYDDEENAICVYEIDGTTNTLYCQRLCLLGKLFLDHKTLFFDVAPFLFYVVTIGNELAGFFSKEHAITGSECNLACILTLPQHQRKGVGNFLISLSYELSRIEGKIGSPERPLSDLGQVSYRSYWAYSIVSFLRTRNGGATVPAKDVSKSTAIRLVDVIATLKSTGLVHIWKGETFASAEPRLLEAAEAKLRVPRLRVNVSRLREGYTPLEVQIDAKRMRKPRGPSSTRKRPRNTTDEITVKRGRVTRSALAASRNGQSSAAETLGATPHDVRAKYSNPVTSRGFTNAQNVRMLQFVRYHTPEVVRAHLNTEEGMPSSLVQELAFELGFAMDKCRKKLRSLAENEILQREERKKGKQQGSKKASKLKETGRSSKPMPETVDVDDQGGWHEYAHTRVYDVHHEAEEEPEAFVPSFAQPRFHQRPGPSTTGRRPFNRRQPVEEEVVLVD